MHAPVSKVATLVSALGVIEEHQTSTDRDASAGVVSPSCKEGNLVSSKAGALVIIKALLSLPIDIDLLGRQPDQSQPVHDTVVEATIVRVAEGVEVESA